MSLICPTLREGLRSWKKRGPLARRDRELLYLFTVLLGCRCVVRSILFCSDRMYRAKVMHVADFTVSIQLFINLIHGKVLTIPLLHIFIFARSTTLPGPAIYIKKSVIRTDISKCLAIRAGPFFLLQKRNYFYYSTKIFTASGCLPCQKSWNFELIFEYEIFLINNYVHLLQFLNIHLSLKLYVLEMLCLKLKFSILFLIIKKVYNQKAPLLSA